MTSLITSIQLQRRYPI